jgi:hypothetical protein
MSMALISTVTVGAGGQASIDFTSIPGTFTDLLIVLNGRADNANTDGNVTFNGLTTNLASRQLYGSGSASGSATNATKVLSYGLADASSYTANVFSNVQIYVPNYASTTTFKSVSIEAIVENNATAAYTTLVAGLWSSNSAITQVTLKADTGNFAQYSTASLYGIIKGSGGATVA